MRNDPLKYAIVSALSLLLGGAETFAIAARPTMPTAAATRHHVATIDGRIEAGATALHRVAFERGREYRVRVEALAPGADVDLQLFSPAGHELDRDTSGQARPEVATVPSGSGRYEVDVTMARCPVERCAYRLVVVAR